MLRSFSLELLLHIAKKLIKLAILYLLVVEVFDTLVAQLFQAPDQVFDLFVVAQSHLRRPRISAHLAVHVLNFLIHISQPCFHS